MQHSWKLAILRLVFHLQVHTVLHWKLTTLSNICWKCRHVFLKFQSRKTLLRCPKLETGFLALLPALRPRAIIVLGMLPGTFWEQKLCSLDVAVARRIVERRVTSGGFPGHDSEDANSPGRRKWWECWALYPFNRQRNNEYFGLKAKYNNKHSEQVSKHLFYNINPFSTHYWHITLWSLFPTCFAFFGAENSQLCQTFAEKCRSFNPGKAFWGARVGETRCLAPASPDWGPGPRRPWRPPQRLWRATAPQPRRGRWGQRSAAASCLRRFFRGTRRPLWLLADEGAEVDAPWEDDGSCRHAELEQWMFWTPHLQNCSRQETFTNALKKHIEQVSRIFKASFLQH